MANVAPRAADGAPSPDDVSDASASRRVAELAARGRAGARHVASRLTALPRLAAAGAARVTRRTHDDHEPSAAERSAERREAALEAAERGAGTDWAHVGIFSAGIAVGALIGAGAALLLAPASGYETRGRLASRARNSSGRLAGRFDELGDGVRRGARRGRKRVTRAVTSARWAAEDAWDRRRRHHDD